MSSGAWEVHVAVMAVLKALGTLPPMFDPVPEDTPYPYGTFGAPTGNPRRLLGAQGADTTLILDWYGPVRERVEDRLVVHGWSQVMQWAADARAALDGVRLPLPSNDVWMLRWVQDRYLPDVVADVRHAQQEFLIVTMPKEG